MQAPPERGIPPGARGKPAVSSYDDDDDLDDEVVEHHVHQSTAAARVLQA
jgi:hypothetical protein